MAKWLGPQATQEGEISFLAGNWGSMGPGPGRCGFWPGGGQDPKPAGLGCVGPDRAGRLLAERAKPSVDCFFFPKMNITVGTGLAT